MKRCGITGSRRYSLDNVRSDVVATVSEIMARGDAIVTGWALGVDQRALETALELDVSAKSILVIIPTPLDVFAQHYVRRAHEWVISPDDAYHLIGLLYALSSINPAALSTMNFSVLHQDTYYARNTEIVNHADIIYWFWVNKSGGVADTLDKARKQGKATIVKEYSC